MKIVFSNRFNSSLDASAFARYCYRPCEVNMTFVKMFAILFVSVLAAYYYGYFCGRQDERQHFCVGNVKRVDRRFRR